MSAIQRREKDRIRRIAEIQNAARTVFLAKGYSHTTMEEIARQAELSKGTIYFYFKSKDDLYISLMVPLMENLQQLLVELEQDLLAGQFKNGMELINGIIEAFINARESDPEALNIFQTFQLNSHYYVMSQTSWDEVAKRGKAYLSVLRRIIKKGVDLDYLRDVDPNQLADLCWGSFLGVVQLTQAKLNLTQKDHLKEMVKFIISSLSLGLSVKNS